MRHLNYNHLLYFWTTAREGSIARAAETLHLTPQTISGQLKLLEQAIGEPLFHRVGRGLALSDTGQMVLEYADGIFTLGAELSQQVRNRQPGRPAALQVGIVNAIPKLIALRLLQPALALQPPVRVVCWEGDMEKLLADLAVHRLDLVLSERELPPGLNVKAFNHSLGQSPVSLFAGESIAGQYQAHFPDCLDQAPFLMPVNTSDQRRALDRWLDSRGIRPRVVGEFDDSALLKAFGEAGLGIFPAPTAIAAEVERMYRARRIGEVDSVQVRYFAISTERQLKHPAVVHLTEAARVDLFGQTGPHQ